jgi:hypothetical protein
MSNGSPAALPLLQTDIPDSDLISDALTDALGKIIAEQRRQWEGERGEQCRQWQRERALIEAQAAALISHLRAECLERLGALKDGKDGDPGPQGPIGLVGPAGPQGSPGPAGESVTGPAGAIGPQGSQGDPGPQGEQGIKGDPGESIVGPPGERGEKGERGDVGEQGAAGAAGQDGSAGAIGPAGERGEKGEQGPKGDTGNVGEAGPKGDKGDAGASGPAGPIGQRGERGEVGPVGPAGLLPIAKVFEPDAVHYRGDVVVHQGATWQATKDTGQTPPHRDWIALAIRGVDAVTPRVRGTFREAEQYRHLDIVALNGHSFIATRDDPGLCPSDGWQMLAMGKKGPAGAIGERGPKGDRGEPAPRLLSWRVDRANYRAIAKMSDGSELPLDLRPLFEQFHSDSR